jgi:hypothetical protein
MDQFAVARAGQVGQLARLPSGHPEVAADDLADLSAFAHLLTAGDSGESRRQAWQRFFDNVGRAAVASGAGMWWRRRPRWGSLWCFRRPGPSCTRSRPGSGWTREGSVRAGVGAGLVAITARPSRSRRAIAGRWGGGCRCSSTPNRRQWRLCGPAGCGLTLSMSCPGDAVVLACAIENPMADRARMRGSDHGRVRAMPEVLADPDHRSWLSMPEQRRKRGLDALLLLVQEPTTRATWQQRNTR